jgi:hypothetical protein
MTITSRSTIHGKIGISHLHFLPAASKMSARQAAGEELL